MIWPREIVCYRHCLNPAPFGTLDISMYSKLYIAWFVELIFHFCSFWCFFSVSFFFFLGPPCCFFGAGGLPASSKYLHPSTCFLLNFILLVLLFEHLILNLKGISLGISAFSRILLVLFVFIIFRITHTLVLAAYLPDLEGFVSFFCHFVCFFCLLFLFLRLPCPCLGTGGISAASDWGGKGGMAE